jgi:membrane protein YdbS with pleckstrin-like domain
MNCTQCGAEAIAEGRYCHQCGADLASGKPTENVASEPTPKQRFAAPLKPRGDNDDDDDAEDVLWQGQYSKLAMIGAWIGASLFSIGMIVLAVMMSFGGTAWLVTIGVIAVAWVGLLARLLYRQLSIHYYLTNQRFIHESGLLWREIDRIEAIDIDDVTFHQGPIERMFGVGTVRLLSSDESTPEFHLIGIEGVRNVATMIDEVRRQERRKRGLHIEAV